MNGKTALVASGVVFLVMLGVQCAVWMTGAIDYVPSFGEHAYTPFVLLVASAMPESDRTLGNMYMAHLGVGLGAVVYAACVAGLVIAGFALKACARSSSSNGQKAE